VVGSVQETQRLLSEPGWRALCLAVSVDFVKFFVFSEGRVLILLVKWFGLVWFVRPCSTGDQRIALGGEHALLQRYDPWAGAVAL